MTTDKEVKLKKIVTELRDNIFRSKMSSADKFEIFLKMCGVIFIILVLLKLFVLTYISWWLVTPPIIIPLVFIWLQF